MRMNIPKKGFTLVEIMLCFVVIGVITIASIQIANPKQKVIRYSYSNLYTSLSDSFYNAMLHRNTIDPFELNASNTSDGPQKLCEALSEYINTANINCTNNVTSVLAEEFNDENIQIRATNSMRIYLSDMQTLEYDLNGSTEKINYFIAFGDINGRKGPNKLEYINERTPSDIFAFALLETGTTVPLGLPEIDGQYLMTKVAFYDINTEIIYKNPAQPYYISKSEAWGNYSNDWTNQDEINLINPDVPFTMNDIIRNNLPPESKIRITVPTTNTNLYDNGQYQCTKADYENCFVVINKYRY